MVNWKTRVYKIFLLPQTSDGIAAMWGYAVHCMVGISFNKKAFFSTTPSAFECGKMSEKRFPRF
jgi:hypothetical protein